MASKYKKLIKLRFFSLNINLYYIKYANKSRMVRLSWSFTHIYTLFELIIKLLI